MLKLTFGNKFPVRSEGTQGTITTTLQLSTILPDSPIVRILFIIDKVMSNKHSKEDFKNDQNAGQEIRESLKPLFLNKNQNYPVLCNRNCPE